MATTAPPLQGPKQIRFVNNQGQPPSKRRRINAACLTCRRRKTRCAGERPSCSTCQKNGHECLGYLELNDKKDSSADDGSPGSRTTPISGGFGREKDQRKKRDRADADEAQSDSNAGLRLGSVGLGSAGLGMTDQSNDDEMDDEPTPRWRAASAGPAETPNSLRHPSDFSDPSDPSGPSGPSGSSAPSRPSPKRFHSFSSATSVSGTTSPQTSAAPLGEDWAKTTGQPSHHSFRPPSQPSELKRRPNYSRSVSFNDEPVPSAPSKTAQPPPSQQSQQSQPESHRVPYFRYFGPTAIVPGYKQMVVDVSFRDRRRSRGESFSASSPGSSLTSVPRSLGSQRHDMMFDSVDDLPVYDPTDVEPVHPLILRLVKIFFVHLGCNYPFLQEDRVLRRVSEKRIEPILVDAMCSLAARFCDPPLTIANDDGEPIPRSQCGCAFAQRAKAATVDTFLCPTIGAVQACLLMAYEGFGADQDSALWMYLGIAIRMAVDVGLQKIVGVQCQDGVHDSSNGEVGHLAGHLADQKGASSLTDRMQGDPIAAEKQKTVVEQERADTFWAVFFLDRVISSGTGRPVTFRDDDFELALPEPVLDAATNWPDPFPALVQIIHIYGRVSDVLNNIHNAGDLTAEKMTKLGEMEGELTRLYQRQDERLNFNATNFQHYVRTGQGTNFILLHFWFHALIIILHQPTLLAPFGSLPRDHQLQANSYVLSMSSAKTIADILAFAELIDPKSFIGNPFTSQPMYIAACAFLEESVANASLPTSRDTSSPPPDLLARGKRREGGHERRSEPSAGEKLMPSSKSSKSSSKPSSKPSSKHSLLASNANQNYQRCYKSLQQMHTYWGGVRYILTALDQKAKGIWDCETFTFEEYESTKFPRRRGSFRQLPTPENFDSPDDPPIGWSLSGTSNSSNPSLTLLFQSHANIAESSEEALAESEAFTRQRYPWQSKQEKIKGEQKKGRAHQQRKHLQQQKQPQPQQQPQQQTQQHPLHPQAANSPPGSMVYDPIRQSIPEVPAVFAPAYPQATESAIRYSSYHPPQHKEPDYRPSLDVLPGALPAVPFKFPADLASAGQFGQQPDLTLFSPSQEGRQLCGSAFGSLQSGSDIEQPSLPTTYTATSSAHPYVKPSHSSGFEAASSMPCTSPVNNSLADCGRTGSHSSYLNQAAGGGGVGLYSPDVATDAFSGNGFPYLAGTSMTDLITLDSQEIDLSSVSLPEDMPQQWLAYLPGDIANLFDGTMNDIVE